MALELPGAVPTLNATIEVRDPTLAATEFYGVYRRVPGASGFTMPANPRVTNEVRQLTGAARVAGSQEPGEISVSFAALHRVNPVMGLIYDNQSTSKYLQWRFRTQPIVVGIVASGFTVAAGELNEIIIAATKQAEVTRLVQEGMVIRINNNDYAIAGYEDDGTVIEKLIVHPAFGAAIGVATAGTFYVPGERHDDIRAQVLAISKGDVQTDSAVGGEMTLQPDRPIGQPDIFTTT